ncbi:DUF86 domain-containing protein [Agromyces sp. Leaf222]|uniref:HepT-like ribonuclease domain-containing protein n=1 Tax=Agromyces sp. Leaf222 TaxID=1735688 RepID=UPI0006F89E0D|nr:HepT-like ribonuclease domain-containing protein [Agromyces sp. Leaf222]KQM81267.1 hypothetical protein ASE68_15880 [Agromyces sp. Leaf222]
MSRTERDRLEDIAVACGVISEYITRTDIDEPIVFDAIRVRLIEIGEAVKDLSTETIASEPEIPWAMIARMRDLLVHRYFDTTHAIITTTARDDVPRLGAAVRRLRSKTM